MTEPVGTPSEDWLAKSKLENTKRQLQNACSQMNAIISEVVGKGYSVTVAVHQDTRISVIVNDDPTKLPPEKNAFRAGSAE
jgi:hypothetical protein